MACTSPEPRQRPVLLVLSGLWAAVTLFVLVCMLLPTAPNTAVFAVSVLAYTYNPFLLLLAVPGVILLTRRRWAAGVLAVAVLGAVAVPTVRLVNTAENNDVDLSVGQLFQGPTGGLSEPTLTTTYNWVDGEDLAMDVWRPKDQAKASNAAMIYVYGGGFESGTRTRWAPFFQHLTGQGITVFSMDYRLSTPTEPSYDKAAGDVKCAVGWVHEHADEYGIDSDRVAISGGSAGGNLALLAAYAAESGAVPASCDVEDTSVRAVAEFYGPPSLSELYTGTPSTPVKGSLERYLGGTPESQPERYRTLSPITYLDSSAPPTLIIQGLHDTGVQPEVSADLAERLETAGVEHELLMLPDTQHGFDAYFGGLANQIAQARLTRFLQQHLMA